MLSISVWRVVLAEFVVSVFPNLGIHVSANNEDDVFRDATNKRGQLITEGDEFSFFSKAVAGDYWGCH